MSAVAMSCSPSAVAVSRALASSSKPAAALCPLHTRLSLSARPSVLAVRPSRAAPRTGAVVVRASSASAAGFLEPRAEVASVPEQPNLLQRLVSAAARVAGLAALVLFLLPGAAHAATTKSSGRVGGSAFNKTSSCSPGPSQSFKGTPVNPPAKSSTATSATSASGSAAGTTNSTTVNKTTVINNSSTPAVNNHHHHSTTVVHAAPAAPCAMTTAAVVVGAAATAAAVASTPMMHPVAPVMAAPMVAHSPMSGASNLVFFGLGAGLLLAACLFMMARRNSN